MIDQPDDLTEHLVAGRRAAYTAVLWEAQQMDNAEHSGDSDEAYGGGHILINGLDIGPAVDAAVMETLVRCGVEPVAFGAPKTVAWGRRLWGKFWHAYTQTMWAGAPLLVTLGIMVACLLLIRLVKGT